MVDPEQLYRSMRFLGILKGPAITNRKCAKDYKLSTGPLLLIQLTDTVALCVAGVAVWEFVNTERSPGAHNSPLLRFDQSSFSASAATACRVRHLDQGTDTRQGLANRRDGLFFVMPGFGNGTE